MKKLLGVIFSTIGNLGVFASFILIVSFNVLNVLSTFKIIVLQRFDFVIMAVLAGIALISYIFSLIGTKLDDSSFVQGAYMKFKRTTMNIVKVLFCNTFILIVLVLGLLGVAFMAFMAFIDDTGLVTNPVDFIVSAVALLLGMSFLIAVFSNYVTKHCPFCGSSYSGGEYEYEEEERSYNTTNDGKVNVNSNIRFEITCPTCNETHTYRRKMKTDAASVQKYADNIIK